MIKEMSNCMSGSMSNCMSGCVSSCISSHNRASEVDKKLVLKNVPPWRKAVVVQNKNSITSIYHVQILALLLKVCYNIKVILNFSGHNVRHRC